ncbi:hypothetical protein [Streptomyces sp. NPDC047079]|uniref:hypothetical protein n=1 Tax=Streptomyces sp. NPDC047079 TaxID=3154607 RepID=UPI0033F4B09B
MRSPLVSHRALGAASVLTPALGAGLAASVLVDAGKGNDVIHGGAGAQNLSGGDGNDSLYGGPGRNVVRQD